MKERWGRLRRRLAGSRAFYYVTAFIFLLLAPFSLAGYGADCSVFGLHDACQKDQACNGKYSCVPSAAFSAGRGALPGSLTVKASPDSPIAEVWLEFGATGVFTPTQTAQGVVFAAADGETPPIPDELAAKGYLAIRVPHAPPAYTPSSLLPGIPPDEPEAIVFSYYAPPGAPTNTEAAVPIVRRTEYEAAVNARYPIGDGRSHWEVWWLPEGEQFPMPSQTFRLDREDFPPPLRVRFRVDFVDADATACSNCQAQVLLYNGHVFVGPYDIPVRYSKPEYEGPLVTFGGHCGYERDDLSNIVGQTIEPTLPFTHVFCLENWDMTARTFNIVGSSSQGWGYTYYTQTTDDESAPIAAPAGPFAVTVGPPEDEWAPGMLAILAVYTPGVAMDLTLRETFDITATSVISPEVWAHTAAFAFGLEYELNEGGGEAGAYLPLIVRRAP